MTQQVEKQAEKVFTVIVNGRPKEITVRELSFDDVVRLAVEHPSTDPRTVYTVTYKRGEGHKPEGTLTPGETVKVKDGMIFNVTATDKS